MAPSPIAPGSSQIELQLSAFPGHLTCRVDDTRGNPLAGAVIQLLPRCQDRQRFAPVFGRTDAAGEARLLHLPPGPAVVVARKPGHATVTQRLEVQMGHCVVALGLPEGAVIAGTVRRRDGTPWPRLALFAEVADGGGGAHDAKLRRVATYSDANGKYVLRDLPHGFVRVRVAEVRSTTWVDCRRFDLRAGQRVAWDPGDRDDPRLRGRVVDSAGQPVAGYIVVATPGRGRRRVNQHRTRTVKTLPDGSFLLRPMERGVSYHVAAYAPEHRKSTVSAAAVAVGCVPGGPLTTLQVDTGVERGKQGLVGLLRHHNGTPVVQASVLVRRLPLDSEERWQLRGEAFRIPLQPGRYEIAFQVPAYGTFSPPAITVQKERYSLLRSMRLPKPGAFAIQISGPAGTDRQPWRLTIEDARRRVVHTATTRAGLRRSLPPGFYVASLVAEGLQPVRRSFRVNGGSATVRVEAMLQPAY